MHRVLQGLALGAALMATSSLNSVAAAGFRASTVFEAAPSRIQSSGNGVRVHRRIDVRARFRGEGRRAGRGGFAYAYPPDYYDANYDIDRSWNSDSFNDWWHDRPDRAYPRWVWHNHDCTADRMWWSGAGWR
ncbi:MAG TPA: hypothetical protein VGU01_09590, partial [Sphingomicrobium sp.]|nr:hypothetical protein [Sphingomicrobium sp.]